MLTVDSGGEKKTKTYTLHLVCQTCDRAVRLKSTLSFSCQGVWELNINLSGTLVPIQNRVDLQQDNGKLWPYTKKIPASEVLVVPRYVAVFFTWYISVYTYINIECQWWFVCDGLVNCLWSYCWLQCKSQTPRLTQAQGVKKKTTVFFRNGIGAEGSWMWDPSVEKQIAILMGT